MIQIIYNQTIRVIYVDSGYMICGKAIAKVS